MAKRKIEKGLHHKGKVKPVEKKEKRILKHES
jgi:hypothetical protein